MSESTSQPEAPHTTTNRSKSAYGYLLLAGVFMLVGISVLIYLGSDKNKVLGNQIADLDIKPLLNTEVQIHDADLKGKIVVLHFWGPWCAPCILEYPEFAKVHHKYKESSDVLVLSVSCPADSKVKKDDLEFDSKRVVQSSARELPIYYDPAEYSQKQISKLLLKDGMLFPTTIVLDREGRVVDYWLTTIEASMVERVIDAQLAKSKSR